MKNCCRASGDHTAHRLCEVENPQMTSVGSNVSMTRLDLETHPLYVVDMQWLHGILISVALVIKTKFFIALSD